MNRTTLLLILFSISASIPAHAMDHKKKESSMRCWQHCALAGAVFVFSSMCTSIGFGMHREIVRQVRSEQNPCLAVWGHNSEYGDFYVKPVLCDYNYSLSDLTRIINRELGGSTMLQTQITPCDIRERHQGPVMRTTRTCIDKPNKITEKQIVKYIPKKQKID